MIDLTRSAGWMRRFADLASCGYNVILTGNTADRQMVFVSGETPSWLPTVEVITTHCRATGYDLVVRYNLDEGLAPVTPEMYPAFDRIAWAQPAPTSVTNATTDGGPRGAVAAVAAEPSPVTPTFPLKIPRKQAIKVVANLLTQSAVPVVVILDYADRLFGEHPGEEEMGQIVCLRRAAERTATVKRTGHPLDGRKNMLVMVTTGPVAGIPAYLYQDHPQLALLTIPKPSRPERHQFISDKLRGFSGGEALNGEQRSQAVTGLANLTEGMSVEDLSKLLLLSRARDIGVENPKLVVNQLKYGEHRDPWRALDVNSVERAEEIINAKVLGQPAAVRRAARSIKHAKVGLNADPDARGPKDVLFFAGPTGTGKTETAKAMAHLLFGDETAMTRLDMSEYEQRHAAERLAGAPPGFTGYEEGGQLTNAVRAKPYQIILLDEIDKANKIVWDKLLQVLEDGRMTDGRGQTAFFENTILIFTSNVGATEMVKEFMPRLIEGTLPAPEEVREYMLKQVHNYFNDHEKVGRPEVFGRIGDERVVTFDLLRPEVIRTITRKFLAGLITSAQKLGHTLVVDSSVESFMAKEMVKPNRLLQGGRGIKTLLRGKVENPLTDWIARPSRPSQMRLEVAITDDGKELIVNGDRVGTE